MTNARAERQQRAELREMRSSQSLRRINRYAEFIYGEIKWCKEQIKLCHSRLDIVTGRSKGDEHNAATMAEAKPVIDKYWHVLREHRVDALEGRLAPEHLPFLLPHRSNFRSVITKDKYIVVDDPEDDTMEMEVLAEKTEREIVERLAQGLPSAGAFMVAWLACIELMVFGMGGLNADTGIELTNEMTAYSARLMELAVLFPWDDVMLYHTQKTSPLFKQGASDPELWKELASDAVSLSRFFEEQEVEAERRAAKSKKSAEARPAGSSKKSTAAAPSSPVQSTTPAQSSPPASRSSPPASPSPPPACTPAPSRPPAHTATPAQSPWPASTPAASSPPAQSMEWPQIPTPTPTSTTSSTGPIRTKSKTTTAARDAANEKFTGTQRQPCFKWNNDGGCTAKCPDGRKHVCRWCRSKEHYGPECNRSQASAKARKRRRRSSQLSQVSVMI